MDYSHSLLQTLEAEKKCVEMYASLQAAKEIGGIHSYKGPKYKPVFDAFTEEQLTNVNAQLKSIGRSIDHHRAVIRNYFG